MRVALVLLLVVGCAAKEKAAKQETTAGAPATGEGGGGAAVGNAAPPPPLDQAKTTPTEDPKADRAQHTGVQGAPPPGGPQGDTVTRGKGTGSAVDAARSGGMLGPSDQRAFQNGGKVSIKSFSSKDLDAAVKTKLEDVQACYDKALEFADKLAGEVTITVKAGKPTVSKSTVKNAELEKCIVDALVAATLPKAKATLVLAFKHE